MHMKNKHQNQIVFIIDMIYNIKYGHEQLIATISPRTTYTIINEIIIILNYRKNKTKLYAKQFTTIIFVCDIWNQKKSFGVVDQSHIKKTTNFMATIFPQPFPAI